MPYIEKRPEVHESGRRIWYSDQMKYAEGERVKATRDYGLIHLGEAGTITGVPALTSPAYLVMPDGTPDKTQLVPEKHLEPE